MNVIRFPYNTNETEYYQYLDKNQDPVPWATSLTLQVGYYIVLVVLGGLLMRLWICFFFVRFSMMFERVIFKFDSVVQGGERLRDENNASTRGSHG